MASRREFFRSLVRPAAAAAERKEDRCVVRPPYAVDESLFHSLCPQCESQACARDCEEAIIVIGADRTPILNLRKGGCTFCEVCSDVCDAGVLDKFRAPERINARFVISTEGCMAHHGTICFACKEPCLENAILFNGLFNPVIDPDLCTGCGFCLGRCPTDAIRYDAVACAGAASENVGV